MLNPDILNSDVLDRIVLYRHVLNPMVLNPKDEAADEVGIEVRNGVEVVPRFTMIICETIIIDMFEYLRICRKRNACIDKQKYKHKAFLDYHRYRSNK